MRTGMMLIILLISHTLHAQVPGLQGKRFSLDGSLMFNTALSNPNENLNQGLTALNKRVQGGAEYIIGRSVSIGASIGSMNSALSYFHYYYFPSSYGYYYSASARDSYAISSKTIGAYFKLFKFRKRGSIAPYGSYVKLGVLYAVIQGKFLESDAQYAYDPVKTVTTSQLLFNYGFGKQFIFKSRFIARMGADLALSPAIIRGSSNIAEAARIRIINGMFFNLEAGIGILLF